MGRFIRLVRRVFGSVKIGKNVVCGGLGIGIDSGKGAEEETRDVSEDGSAAGRDFAGGEEGIEIGEGVVDALSGLEAAGIKREEAGEVSALVALVKREMTVAIGAVAGGESEAAAAGGSAMVTARVNESHEHCP